MVTMSPSTRVVVGATVATLGGVIKRLLLTCVHGSVRTIACHFRHIYFFQSEQGMSLIKDRKRITLANQVRNTVISFWKIRYQLKVIVDMNTNIPQLVREHLKTLIVSRDIGKILHMSVGELLLESDNASILIILENISQSIPGLFPHQLFIKWTFIPLLLFPTLGTTFLLSLRWRKTNMAHGSSFSASMPALIGFCI